jgi:tRNA dimethylallyltransferase
MFSNGLLEETESLMKLCGNSDLGVLRSLGYLQAVRYLKGEWTLETAVSDCQAKTRNYAKRQMTWFRSDASINWINEFGASDKAKNIALHTATAFFG